MNRVAALLCALLLAGGPAASSECLGMRDPALDQCLKSEGWTFVKRKSSSNVYTRRAPGTSLYEVLASSAVPAPPETVFAVIADYPSYPRFMPYVDKSEVVHREERATWVFQQLDFPWPISDRYYTIRLTADLDRAEDGFFRVDWVLAEEDRFPRTGKGEEVDSNAGHWVLQPLDEGRQTHVIYSVLTDPGGRLPDWVVNRANTIAVPKVVRAVRKRAVARGP